MLKLKAVSRKRLSYSERKKQALARLRSVGQAASGVETTPVLEARWRKYCQDHKLGDKNE